MLLGEFPPADATRVDLAGILGLVTAVVVIDGVTEEVGVGAIERI
jgi:hypothetical protein